MTKALVTPRGRLRFPSIHKPDAYEDQAPKYKADIVCEDSERLQAFMATCRKMLDDEIARAKSSGKKASQSPNGWPFSEDTDGETETGLTKINCRQKAQWPSGDPRPSPKVYGPDNNHFADEVHHGADAQVAVEPFVWSKAGKFGINLSPIRVRIYENGQPRGVTDAELDGLAWDEEGTAPAGISDADADQGGW